jgi:hypothetical protein
METKKIIGILILGISVGFLVFLYKGKLQPRLQVDEESKSGITPSSINTTTATK